MQLGTVTLTELADLPAPPPVRRARPGGGAGRWGCTSAARRPRPLRRRRRARRRLAARGNLAQYLAYCGATAVVLPESLADRPAAGRSTARRTRTRPAPIGSTCCAGSWSARAARLARAGVRRPGAAGPAAARLARGRWPRAWPGSTAGAGRRPGLSSAPPRRPRGDAAAGRRGARRARTGPAADPRRRPADPAGARPDPARRRPTPGSTTRPTRGSSARPSTPRRRGRSPAWRRRPGRFAARLHFLAGVGPDALADLAIAGDGRALRRAGRRGRRRPSPARSWRW